MATITGTSGSNLISGTNVADRILADAGNDTIFGNGGNDTIFGQTGDDLLIGGSGNDLLYGGAGADILVGGSGQDVFVFATRAASDGFDELDRIADFTTEDTIAIDNDLYPAVGSALTSSEFKVVGTGGIVDSTDRIIYNISTGQLFYDFNGSRSGGRVVLADLEGNPGLTVSDFLIF